MKEIQCLSVFILRGNIIAHEVNRTKNSWKPQSWEHGGIFFIVQMHFEKNIQTNIHQGSLTKGVKSAARVIKKERK